MSDSSELTFEQALEELERVVRELEEGQLGLDEALVRYERGVALIRACQERLNQVEQKIALITSVDADGLPTLTPFRHEATTKKQVEKKQADELPRIQTMKRDRFQRFHPSSLIPPSRHCLKIAVNAIIRDRLTPTDRKGGLARQ